MARHYSSKYEELEKAHLMPKPLNVDAGLPDYLDCDKCQNLKGIVPQFIFYQSNLIFWILMGCGITRLGRTGL